MASGEFRYSIDTSALLEAFIRRYPPDIAPKMWDEWLPKLIEDERLFAAYDVLEDLSVRDDDIFKWAKSYDKMFVEIDRYEPELSQIMVDRRTARTYRLFAANWTSGTSTCLT